MTNNKQQTAVNYLLSHIWTTDWVNYTREQKLAVIEQAKEMEKEQSIGLIKQTAMFMAASHLDEDIADMSYEDVYKTYYNETYGGNK
jgi:hypothetical protein